MLRVGFFENLASERGIAERCQDSLAIRAFLGYDPTENTPDHASLSVIRNRLGTSVRMIESNYIELTTIEEAKSWFSIKPRSN